MIRFSHIVDIKCGYSLLSLSRHKIYAIGENGTLATWYMNNGTICPECGEYNTVWTDNSDGDICELCIGEVHIHRSCVIYFIPELQPNVCKFHKISPSEAVITYDINARDYFSRLLNGEVISSEKELVLGKGQIYYTWTCKYCQYREVDSVRSEYQMCCQRCSHIQEGIPYWWTILKYNLPRELIINILISTAELLIYHNCWWS